MKIPQDEDLEYKEKKESVRILSSLVLASIIEDLGNILRNPRDKLNTTKTWDTIDLILEENSPVLRYWLRNTGLTPKHFREGTLKYLNTSLDTLRRLRHWQKVDRKKGDPWSNKDSLS